MPDKITSNSSNDGAPPQKQKIYRLLKKRIGINFFSQATQDVFVIKMLSAKREGFYVEVGAGHPTASNNTYLLETAYDWKGLSLEMDSSLVDLYNTQRSNRAIAADATSFEFGGQLHYMNAPKQIDYLQLDIDPAQNTYKALLKIPHNNYRFSVITYEHDRYQSGDKYRNLSRQLLSSLGYQLVCSDCRSFGNEFEDWWIDPTIVPIETWKPFERQSIEFFLLWD